MKFLKGLDYLVDQKPKLILGKLLFLFHQLKQVSVLHKPHGVVTIGLSMLIQPTQIKVQNMSNFQIKRSFQPKVN